MAASTISGPGPRHCPLCARDNYAGTRLPYAEDPWILRQCAGCGLVYLENPPPPQTLEEDLAWEKTFYEERRRRHEHEPVLQRLGAAINFLRARVVKRDKLSALARRYFPPGRVLDVGCSDGSALARLPAGYVPFGIEVSKVLCRMAEEKFSPRGGRSVCADALSGMREFADASFGGVVMMSYLEHEPNPRLALEQAARLLKPGARLIIKVPNYACWNRAFRGARWCGFRSPEHVNYFTPQLLARLVTECGLHVRRFGFRDRLPTSDNMWLVAEKPAAGTSWTQPASNSSRAMKRCVTLLTLLLIPAMHLLAQGRAPLPAGSVDVIVCGRTNTAGLVLFGPPLGILFGLLRAASWQGFLATTSQLGLERD